MVHQQIIFAIFSLHLKVASSLTCMIIHHFPVVKCWIEWQLLPVISKHANLKRFWRLCLLGNISSSWTRLLCVLKHNEIKKLTPHSSTVFNFLSRLRCFCSTHLLLPLSAPLFLFLAVFEILFQVLTHFVASKIRGTEKNCDFPEEPLWDSSGVYKVGIISLLPNCSLVGFLFLYLWWTRV